MQTWHKLTLDEIRACSGHMTTVDIETNGLYWWEHHIIGIGIHCPTANVSGYYPTPTPEARKEAIEAIQSWDKDTILIAHNAKFELHFLGLDPYKIKIYDTAIMIHLLDSRYQKALVKAEKIFLKSTTKQDFIDQAPKKVRKKIWLWAEDLIAQYCINDCIVEHKLFEVLLPQLERWNLWKLFQLQSRLIKTVWKAESKGIEINRCFLEKALDVMAKDIESLAQELYDICGSVFNWRSPQQLSKAIWEGMGIVRPKKPKNTKYGDAKLYTGPMTSKTILDRYNHPVAPIIARLRESSVLRKTVEKYLKLSDGTDKLHPTFKIVGTLTGRFSCQNPNLQNIASKVRDKIAKNIESGTRIGEYDLRRAFIAPAGHSFLAIDYSQMEVRMFAILAQDEYMLSILEKGGDIHAETAKKIWGECTPTYRAWAKAITFGVIYGMGVVAIGNKLGLDFNQAQDLYNEYMQAYPKIKTWMYQVSRYCLQNGYVRYWSSRLWKEENKDILYRSVNAMVQGSCADLLAVVAIRVDNWLQENIPEGYIANFIHDELLISVPKEKAIYAAKQIQEIMAIPELFGIAWPTSAKIGTTYGSLEDVDYDGS